MKTLFIITTIISTLFAQDYQRGNIDMHGGKFDNYNSIGGYKDGGFRKSQSLSMILDKNSTKQIHKNQSGNKIK